MKKDLTIGNPSKVILLFTVPLFLSVVFQQLYCIADSFIAGRYAGGNALAAVGNSYEITLIYLACAFGLNTGCQVISARLYGAKRYSEFKSCITTTFIFSLIVVIILTALGLIFAQPLLMLIKTPSDIMADSLLYLNIYTLGLFFLFFYNIATGIFSAIGDSKTPFIFLLASSVCNVFLDLLFVIKLNMGVGGVAWATFICQGVASVLSMIVLFIRIRKITKGCKTQLWSGKIFKDIMSVCIPSTIQQGSISIGNIIIQGRINSFGAEAIAGYAAAVKLNNLFVTSITAVGSAMSNFTAQNMGANKIKRIKSGYISALILNFCIVIVFTSIYLIFSHDLVQAFMGNTKGEFDIVKAVDAGGMFLFIVSPFYILVGVKIVSDGILRGTIRMKEFMFSTILDLVLRVVLAYLLSINFGVNGIWCAWPIGWGISMVVSLIFTIKTYKKLSNNEALMVE